MVVLALERDRALAAPERPDHVDRLLERLQGLSRRARRAAHGGDPVPEGARAETELEAPAREHVERGGLLGEHRRVAERQVGDVREEADALRACEQVGEQRPGFEITPLVGWSWTPMSSSPSSSARRASDRASSASALAGTMLSPNSTGRP